MGTVLLDTGLRRTDLASGLVVLSEAMPAVRSVATGIFVRTASAHEQRAKMGVSHLLEHMVFKGTERRSARQLALELEVRGGALDAFTGRDYTSFQAHILDEDLPLAVDILTDLVRRPLLDERDLVPERNVILEEINGVLDTPDDLVHELHAATLWPDHPYGYSILGTPETVTALGTRDLREAHRGYYPANCVVAAAGNVDHDRLLEALGREGWLDGAAPEAPRSPVMPEPAVRGVTRAEVRESTQTHIVFGTDTFPVRDSRRFALGILVNAFGGGMSSRLFQRVREELGLAYAIFAFKQFYQSTGQLGVYVGTQPATADQAIEAIRQEYDRMAGEGLAPAELEDGKRQLKGQVVLSLESPGARMHRLAGFVLHDDRYRALGELLGDIEAVTPGQVAAVAAEFFPAERQTVVRLGPDGNGER